MHRLVLVCLSTLVCASAGHAAEWQLQRVNTPARVNAIDTFDGDVHINAGGLWYRIAFEGGRAVLKFVDTQPKPRVPDGALPDGRVVTGKNDVARAWFAQPTRRYDHGILGDKIEAGSLVIETTDGKRHEVKLEDDAVFEDLEPRLADLDGDGHDKVIVVKSYLKRGSALAVIGEKRGRYQVIAETPPLGAPQRWLDPAGVADFNGNGKLSIAIVRQPHVVGALELWSWSANALHKVAEIDNTANHIAGTRAIDMDAVADFDGDGIADIAVPSLDRNALRILTFAPQPHEIANMPLPAKAQTNLGLVRDGKAPVILLGLADGSLVAIRQ